MMNWSGIILGVFMLFAIGIGFVWVIKLEYYVGAHIWKYVFAVGALVTIASLFLDSFYLSAIFGIIGGSIMWGATELPDQEKRVAAGLFPANPRRKKTGKGG